LSGDDNPVPANPTTRDVPSIQGKVLAALPARLSDD
jgi:hypothetical protein